MSHGGGGGMRRGGGGGMHHGGGMGGGFLHPYLENCTISVGYAGFGPGGPPRNMPPMGMGGGYMQEQITTTQVEFFSQIFIFLL